MTEKPLHDSCCRRRSRRGRGDHRPGRFPFAVFAPARSALIAGAAFGAAAASLHGASARAAGLATVQVVAERTTLRADGRSTTVLTALVKDDRGAYVPDGTRVRFATTAGRLDSTVAITQNGVARVILTSADIASTAIVTATLDASDIQAAPTTLTISFTTDAAASETGPTWIRVDGGYVGYIADYRTIQANGRRGAADARVTYRGLTISADTLQLDVGSTAVLAQGHVTVREDREGDGRAYDALKLDLRQGQGLAEKLDADGLPTPVRLARAANGRLEESPIPAGQPTPGYSTWKLKDLSDANVAVISKSIALNPGNQIQFRRATFYFGGQKTLSLPFHVMELQQNQLFREQVLGYGPTGITVDFPLYYDMRPNGAGTLHFRHGAQVGSSAYSIEPGWHADIEQTYNGKNGMEGSVELDNVTQGNWGVRVRHAESLDPSTRGSLFVDFPNNRNLFVTTQVQRDYGRFMVNGTLYGSRAPNTPTDSFWNGANNGILRGQVYAEGTPQTLLGIKPLRYALSVGYSRQSYYGFTESSQGLLSNANLGLRMFTSPMTIGRNTTITQSVSVGQAWLAGSALSKNIYSGPGSGMTLLGTTSVNRSLGALGTLGFTYDYAQTPGGFGYTGSSSLTPGRHRAGLNLFLGNGDKVSLTVNASQGLDVPNTQVFSTLMLGLGGAWRSSITFTSTKYVGYAFTDAEFRIGRRVMGRDIDLFYSTTARKFQLELAGVRF